MEEALRSLATLLTDVILPNLKAVQESQGEQLAANDRLENTIQELRLHLDSQLTQLSAQITAFRAELAAAQATLKAVQAKFGYVPDRSTLIH
jgi:hypothetical protein